MTGSRPGYGDLCWTELPVFSFGLSLLKPPLSPPCATWGFGSTCSGAWGAVSTPQHCKERRRAKKLALIRGNYDVASPEVEKRGLRQAQPERSGKSPPAPEKVRLTVVGGFPGARSATSLWQAVIGPGSLLSLDFRRKSGVPAFGLHVHCATIVPLSAKVRTQAGGSCSSDPSTRTPRSRAQR